MDAAAPAGSTKDLSLVHEPDPVLMANVRWLAGYWHPRCLRPAVAACAAAVFAAPVSPRP